MTRSITILALIALPFLALPVSAQQDTTGRATGRERTSEDAGQGTAADTTGRPTTAVPGAERMGADSSMLGRQGEGVSKPGNVSDQRFETTGAARVAPAAPADRTGGAMPTTGSALPAALLLGFIVIGIGLGMGALLRNKKRR